MAETFMYNLPSEMSKVRRLIIYVLISDADVLWFIALINPPICWQGFKQIVEINLFRQQKTAFAEGVYTFLDVLMKVFRHFSFPLKTRAQAFSD